MGRATQIACTYGSSNSGEPLERQSGSGGLSSGRKVKTAESLVWVESQAAPHSEADPDFLTAPWVDAELLPAPTKWSALPDGIIPLGTHGFDGAGVPKSWPMRFTNAHWAAVLPGLPKGEFTFRCRSIDDQGYAQPLPRPFRKSGHAAIEAVDFQVGE